MPTPISIYSGSSCSAIVGLNPHRTPRHAWQVIQEILHPGFNKSKGWTLPPFPDSAPIRWGNAFEEPVIRLAEEKEGEPIINREKIFRKDFGDIELTMHQDGEYRYAIQQSNIIRPRHEGKTTNERAFKQVKEHVLRWGNPGTDQVPEEYQVQAAIQRICTGAELVKLSVLVFPKSQDDFEKEGWVITEGYASDGEPFMMSRGDELQSPLCWARTFAEIGNFHTYNLPRFGEKIENPDLKLNELATDHEDYDEKYKYEPKLTQFKVDGKFYYYAGQELEAQLIKTIQEFDARYVKTQIPPEASNYDDIKRLLINPIGTIEATPEILKLIYDHIELGNQLGSKSPLKIRRDRLKVEICNFMETARKKSGIDPADKMIIIDPNGGDKLATLGLNVKGVPYFKTKKAE